MEGGTYTTSDGKFLLPSGSSLTTIANYNGGSVTINGRVELNSSGAGNVFLQGISIRCSGSDDNCVKLHRISSTRATNVTLKNLNIQGGTDHAVHICGNITASVRANIIDGGRDHHVMKWQCNVGSSCSSPNGEPGICDYAPSVGVEQNFLQAVNAFPGTWANPREDILAPEGWGDSVIRRNTFGLNTNGEDCIDVKGTGLLRSSMLIERNDIGGSSCGSGAAIIIHGNADVDSLGNPAVTFQYNHVVNHSIQLQDTTSAALWRNYLEMTGKKIQLQNKSGGNCNTSCTNRGSSCTSSATCGTCAAGQGCDSMGGWVDVASNTIIGGEFQPGSSIAGACPDLVDVHSNIFSGVLITSFGTNCTNTSSSDLQFNVDYTGTNGLRVCSVTGQFCSSNSNCSSNNCFSADVSSVFTRITGDPQLTGFHIGASSSAKDTGSSNEIAATQTLLDLDNELVPDSVDYDIGVDERY